MKQFYLLILMLGCTGNLFAQSPAKIQESTATYKTYPFSRPDPSAPSKTIYPYFRYNGFTNVPEQKNWKTVVLENDFIKVTILPEIGGKIWNAVDKKTGRSFIYNNEVVKFRDIAMRGPWTSGGIEPNYGIIGHTPNCATNVDYLTRTNADGSVSCFVGTLDLLTQTWWTIEVRLPKDKVWFTTRSFWQNNFSLEQPYYTWMNTGLPAGEDLEFVYPGNYYLGHEGDFTTWPLNLREHKNISRYASNDFGSYKSYHVFGRYTNFFGAYWHKSDQGMGRYSLHDEKAGKKIWIWGLSRQGMIWEKLLTDNNGQYVEVQSGRLFNQTGDGSSATPFKHFGFEPYQTDTWTEYWFPVHGTGGMVHADPQGALNVARKGNAWMISYQAFQNLNADFEYITGNANKIQKTVSLRTQEIFKDSIAADKGTIDVFLNGIAVFESRPKDGLSRPLESPIDFDWTSAYGFWIKGKEAERSRDYERAEKNFRASLEKDRNFVPSLAGIASLFVRKEDYPRARIFAMRGLAVDTYDPDCNYLFAIASAAMGNKADARDGYDMAALSISHRSAAYTRLSKWYLSEGRIQEALIYAGKAMENNTGNTEALQVKSVCERLMKEPAKAEQTLKEIEIINPLNHFVRLERWIGSGSPEHQKEFASMLRNELPYETLLHYSDWYADLNLFAEAAQTLTVNADQTEILYRKAWLNYKLGKGQWKEMLRQADQSPVRLVFPSALKSMEVMEWAEQHSESWKPKYYQALLYRARGMNTDTAELLKRCGESPDAAEFYSLRAEIFPEQAEADLKKATALDPKELVYAKKLFEVLIKKEKSKEALTLASTYHKMYPDNSNLIMMHAKALVLNEQYGECNKLLAGATLLPYEGSTESRLIYHHSWMMTAAGKLKAGKPAEAIKSVETALQWPEQLGVGKPYEDDLDIRPELFLQYLSYRKMNKTKEAEALAEKIRSKRKTETASGKWAAILLGLSSSGKQAATESLKKWKPSEQDKDFRDWCMTLLEEENITAKPDSENKQLAATLLMLVKP